MQQQDVIIRDPVVAQATLPRFLSLGDQSRFHVQIDNVEGKSGRYASISTCTARFRPLPTR